MPMDGGTAELMVDWTYAWRGVAFAADQYKILQSKGRYKLAQFDTEPRLRLDRMMAVEMGVELYLAKWMLQS